MSWKNKDEEFGEDASRKRMPAQERIENKVVRLVFSFDRKQMLNVCKSHIRGRGGGLLILFH